jgi:hypothetical protein
LLIEVYCGCSQGPQPAVKIAALTTMYFFPYNVQLTFSSHPPIQRHILQYSLNKP